MKREDENGENNGNDGDDNQSENPAAPVIEASSVVSKVAVTATTDIDGSLFAGVDNPIAGLVYTIKNAKGEVIGTKEATEADQNNEFMKITLDETVTAAELENIKEASTDRISLTTENNVEVVKVKLFENEDLNTVAEEFSNVALDKDAIAIINGVEYSVSKDDAINDIIKAIGDKVIIGKEYNVTLIDSTVEVGKDGSLPEGTQTKEYKIVF